MSGRKTIFASFTVPWAWSRYFSPERTEYRWDDEAANAKPGTPNHVWIFQRTK